MEQNLSQQPDEVVRFLPAQIRSSSGSVNQVRVLDITEAGCLIDKRALMLKGQDRVLIKLKGLTYLAGSVLWTDNEQAGLMFEEPLYSAVLQHLKTSSMVTERS